MAKKQATFEDEQTPTGKPNSKGDAVAPSTELFELLTAIGLAPVQDFQAHNFALVANKSPKVHGKDAQLIFDYTEDGEVIGLRVL